MPEENKAEAAVAEPQQQTGRVWTDEEHDAYVKARIDKQAAKFAEKSAALDARIAELEAANKEKEAKLAEYEARVSHIELVKKVARETGMPESFIAELRGDDEEALKASLERARPSVQLYPTAPAGAAGGPVKVPSMTKDEIAKIRDPKKRLAQIEANLDQYI